MHVQGTGEVITDTTTYVNLAAFPPNRIFMVGYSIPPSDWPDSNTKSGIIISFNYSQASDAKAQFALLSDGKLYYRLRFGYSNDFSSWDQLNSDRQPLMLESPYPSYKINAYPNIFFGGDSVTKGFVVEGTEDNPSSIYREMTEYSYPVSFNRIYPGTTITTVAQTGISAYGYYYNKYPDIDFSKYNLIIIELGLNGSDHGFLNINDIDTENTNTWCLKKLVEGIRFQNSDAQIALVRSQHFINGGYDVFTTICSSYDALFVDLHNADYLNLADAKYHGYYSNNGSPAIDYAHFTRRGYAAKAYVIARLLGDLLPD